MQTEFTPPTVGPGYASGPVTKPPHWHALVAWDLLFNNLASGLFLVAAISDLVAPEIYGALTRVAYPIALVFLVIDLVCLVLDLGDPLRFHHMLRVIKPSSPMSFGTWCLTIFSAPLTVAAVLTLIPDRGLALEWARKLALVLGLLPAFGSAIYKGVLLSTNAQPGWRDARWLGGYLGNSALLLGCAQMLTLAVVMGQESATSTLRVALGVLLVLNAIALGLLALGLRPELGRVWRVGVLAVGAGMLVPLVLLLAGSSPLLMLGAVLLILLGSLVIRFLIIRIPHVHT